MFERINCTYPNNKPYTSYRYGCRCEDCVNYVREYTNKNAYKYKVKSQAYHRVWYQRNKKRIQQDGQSLKKLVFTNYGGVCCTCCHEERMTFLCLDHVNNDGKQDRLIRGLGDQFYRSLMLDGFPDKERYQVLCFNCNCGRKLNGGVCPHKTSIRVEAY